GNVGLSGKPGQKGETGPKGNKGEPGEPGKPGDPGLRGKDGEAGVPGEQGERGVRGATGEKGDKGESVHPLENSITIKGEKGEPGLPGKGMEIKDLESLFDAYGIKLALLKELTDLLLQEGVEIVTQQIAASRKGKGKASRKKQSPKQTTDQVTSVKCDVPSVNPASATDIPREDLSINLKYPVPEAVETLLTPSTLPPSTIATTVTEQTFTTTINSPSGVSEITTSHIDLDLMEAMKTTENPEGENAAKDENFLLQGGVAGNATLETQEDIFFPEESSIEKEMPPILEPEMEDNSSEYASKEVLGPVKKRRGERKKEKEPSQVTKELGNHEGTTGLPTENVQIYTGFESAGAFANGEETSSLRVRRMVENRNLTVKSFPL
ncbi:hypothetical protein JD844_028984, partial [Phrynosoma platyrhinos]